MILYCHTGSMAEIEDAVDHAIKQAKTDTDPEARRLYQGIAECMQEMKDVFEAAGKKLAG